MFICWLYTAKEKANRKNHIIPPKERKKHSISLIPKKNSSALVRKGFI